MESITEAFSLGEALLESVKSGSNCILIGELHDICPGLLPVASLLLRNHDFYSNYNICIFTENYPALGADCLKPFSIQDLIEYERNLLLRPLLIQLVKNGVNIYGLETPHTNPFHFFTNEQIPWGIESLPRLLDIAKEYQLVDLFEATYAYSIEEFCKEHDFDTTLTVLMNIYSTSNRRLAIPNQDFCSIIERIPADSICINIVGNTHIPTVRAKDSGRDIDVGMENRLCHQLRTRNLLVTTITYYQPQPKELYTIEEPFCEYAPIRRVSQVEDPDQIFDSIERNPLSPDLVPPSTPIVYVDQQLPARHTMTEVDEMELNSDAFEEIYLSQQEDDYCCCRNYL